MNYYVAVVTGNYWNAGTSADVYITLYGERGDTGPRLLFKTKRAKKFDKGKVSIVSIQILTASRATCMVKTTIPEVIPVGAFYFPEAHPRENGTVRGSPRESEF